MTAPEPTANAATAGFEIEPAGHWEWTLLALGVVLRLLLQIPLHRYPGDADCVLTALQGIQVLHGEPAVFVPSGYRLGALNAYVTAASFALFGVGRVALAAGVFAVSTLQMLLWWLATRELVGSRLARVALAFILLPSAAVLEWGLHLPNANPEIFLASTAVIWLGARLRRRGGGAMAFLAFGLACGVAFWASLLTLAVSVPTAIWVARKRGGPSFLSAATATVAGALAGASPWLGFNLRYGWQSLTKSSATEPVNDWATLLESLRNLWSDRIVHLFTGADGLGYHAVPAGMPRLILWAASVALAFVVLGGAAVTAFGRARRTLPPRERAVLMLAFSIFALLVLLNLVSRMSLLGGSTVRYLLPAALFFPPLFALAWGRAGERERKVLAGLAAAALLLHLTGSSWPWTDYRARMRDELAQNRRLARALVEQGVDVVYGPYWVAYPLILDSDLRLIGVPVDPNNDFLRQRARTLPNPARWAIAGYRHQAALVSRRFGKPRIDAEPFFAVFLDEGTGPVGHANGRELTDWATLLNSAPRRQAPDR